MILPAHEGSSRQVAYELYTPPFPLGLPVNLAPPPPVLRLSLCTVRGLYWGHPAPVLLLLRRLRLSGHSLKTSIRHKLCGLVHVKGLSEKSSGKHHADKGLVSLHPFDCPGKGSVHQLLVQVPIIPTVYLTLNLPRICRHSHR